MVLLVIKIDIFLIPKLLPRPSKANLAFRWPLTNLTPLVFHADQCGIGRLLIWTPGPEFCGHPHPHWGPQHKQGQELILEPIHRRHIFRHSKFNHLKVSPAPSRHLSGIWGHLHPNGEPQH